MEAKCYRAMRRAQGKNAARVLLGSVCRKPVKEVWLQRGKNQDDGQ